MCDEEEEGVSLEGYARVTYSISAVFHNDYDRYEEPDETTFSFTSIIPDHSLCKARAPERILSAGEILGMELCKLARAVRAHVCDWEDVLKGFEREMGEPY